MKSRRAVQPETPEEAAADSPKQGMPATVMSDSASPSAETSPGVPVPYDAKPSPEDWVGRFLGKYEIIGVLGQGAMGVVLKARDPMIEREVAIKVLADHLASDEIALARFLAEARAAGKLNHPNVMAIYEIGRIDATHFLVLEYVTGGSLEDRLMQRRSLSVLEATQALIDACKGVGAAHAAGLIHRDIKPANFMRAADGSIKVADFGLAKASADANRHLTQTGIVVGTPYFMSPEQCEAKPLDCRSDIYALGATYYSLLTGQYPYEESESVVQLMFAHCHAPVPDPRAVDPAIPEACGRVVARAMAKAPGDRYASTTAMLADLQAVFGAPAPITQSLRPIGKAPAETPPTMMQPPAPSHRRRRLAIAGCLAAAAAIALAGLLAWRPREPAGVVPGPHGEPIAIGVLHSLSGSMAMSEAPVVDAINFAIDEVNRAGGVLGRPVKAIVADGRSDPAVFAQEAERLIDQEKVVTLLGCWTSASRKAVKPIVEKHDHLLIYPLQFEGLEMSPCIVYLGAAPNQQILPALQWAMQTHKSKRFFLVGSDYVFPHAAHAIIKDYLTRKGVEVAGEAYVPLGSQKVDPAVHAIAKAKPDMILNTLNGDSNVGFFRALRAEGIMPSKTPTLSFSIDEQGLRSLNPAQVAGDYAAWTYFQSLANPLNEDFVRRFRAKYPQHNVTDPMETAYMGVKLWAQAVSEAKSLEPKKIRRALLNQQFEGPGGDVRVDPDTQYCCRTPRIGQIDATGQFKAVWSAPAPVRPEPFPNTRTAEAWRAFLHDLYVGWGNRWAAPE